MKIGTLILIGITLSLIGLWAIAYNNENGDSNAILMYFTVYGIVAIGIGIINGFFLKFAEKQTEKGISLIALGLLPLGILLGFLLSGIFRMTFIGEFGLIGIGITNLIWIIERILTENKKASV
jgi:hypothetical protein